jgi:hypothetical protein
METEISSLFSKTPHLELCYNRCVCENLGYVGSQTQLCYWGVFNDYVLKQLHVSACDDDLHVVLGKLKILL